MFEGRTSQKEGDVQKTKPLEILGKEIVGREF